MCPSASGCNPFKPKGKFTEFFNIKIPYEKEVDAMLKESKSYLDGVATKLRNKGIACKTLVTFGPVVEKIIEAAHNEDAVLIAMTSHGYGGLTRIFYGSVAAGVLNRIDRPLFIVRSRWAE